MTQNKALNERDLETLFLGGKKKKRKNNNAQFLYYVIGLIALTLVTFVTLNFKSIESTVKYWYENDYKVSDSNNLPNTTNNIQTKPKQEEAPDLPSIADNSIFIQSINVSAPIKWGVNNTPKEVEESLKNGIIQINGTAKPGEKGNVFITGHSSNYPWIKGNYNQIFALLNKLVIGDNIQIKYNNVDYLYKVSEIKVVEPNDTSVMEQTNNSILTLMTCTPVGTSLRRLIVISNQIYPNPANNKQKINNSSTQSMPKKVH